MILLPRPFILKNSRPTSALIWSPFQQIYARYIGGKRDQSQQSGAYAKP